ncbi:MAG: 3-deoxy-7-phosphoheptulonate synthase, partial [Oscillospiraceae bacterium]|nr:3-deoxy-7-phosphoheptulonate synthase [Oscillospiraceae bacterium]
MILVLKQNPDKEKLQSLIALLAEQGFSTNLSEGTEHTILGIIGDTSKIDPDSFSNNEIVESVKRISEPYKMANRKMHPMDTVINLNGINIGEGFFSVIAGPCSVECEEQIIGVAKAVKKSGAKLLRGGAFKPRTSPYSFQGLQADGIKLLLEAKKETGLPIVTEIMNLNHIDMFADVDIIQVGARNMQNFD